VNVRHRALLACFPVGRPVVRRNFATEREMGEGFLVEIRLNFQTINFASTLVWLVFWPETLVLLVVSCAGESGDSRQLGQISGEGR